MNSNVTGTGDADGWCWCQKRPLPFSPINSIDMKTQVVKHVPRINLSHFNFLIFNFDFFNFPGSKCDFQNFFFILISLQLQPSTIYVKIGFNGSNVPGLQCYYYCSPLSTLQKCLLKPYSPSTSRVPRPSWVGSAWLLTTTRLGWCNAM